MGDGNFRGEGGFRGRNNVTLSPLNVKELNQLQGIKLKPQPMPANNIRRRNRQRFMKYKGFWIRRGSNFLNDFYGNTSMLIWNPAQNFDWDADERRFSGFYQLKMFSSAYPGKSASLKQRRGLKSTNPDKSEPNRGGSRTAPTTAWQRGYDISFLPTCLY